MENRPPITSSPLGSINSYRKRRQRRGPNVIYIVAGVLILGGIILLIVWLTGDNTPLSAIFATETPTPTLTFTPTNTSTPTETPTATLTLTITPTPTFSTNFNYTVEAGDSLFSIVEKFNLGDDGIAWILLLNPLDPATLNIVPGDILLLPAPGAPFPTATPIPADLPKGTKIDYTVQPGDTIAGIASKFNSTEEAIVAENNITDPNALFVGQLLVIPVNLVTATPTRPPTSTPITPGPGTSLPTPTFTPVN
jgi:LysM repeat protein